MEARLFGVEVRAGFGSGRAARSDFSSRHITDAVLHENRDIAMETQGQDCPGLQEQTFTQVGGNRKIAVEVRVVCDGPPRDLQTEIRAGRFREDLSIGLNVVPLKYPISLIAGRDIPSWRSISLRHAFMRLTTRIYGDAARRVSCQVSTKRDRDGAR